MPVNKNGEFIPSAAAGIFGGCDNCGCASCAGSSGGECCNCRFILQVPCGSAPNAQSLSLLATGIVKNTTGTGVLSIATVGVDYSAPITVEEEDGTPSFDNINAIRFPSAKGFTLSNPDPGVVTVDLADVLTTTVPFSVRSATEDPITDGIKGEITIDFDCVIESVVLIADQTGDVSVDIEKSTFLGYPGSLASIVAASPPVLSSGLKFTDTTLTGWTTAVAAGSVLRYTLSGTTNITRLLIALKVRRV